MIFFLLLLILLPLAPFFMGIILWGLVLRRGKIILRVTISIVCSLGKGLRENEYVRRWLERHQRLSTFLHARISIATFQGLPLSLLLLATIYSFSIFSGLVEDYLTNAPLVALDVRLANLFYAFRDEELVQVFYAITALANVTTVLVAVLFLTGILWWQRRRITVATLWIAFLGSEGMTTLGKFLVHRQRPASFLSVLLEDSYSFPSGHATSAVVLFGFLAYLIIREHRSWRVKVSAFFAAIILIFLIDLSRLYLGVHYLSDVLAGNMLSCSVLLFAISTGEWIQARQKKIMKPFIWKTIAPFPFLMALLVGVYVNIVPLTPKTIGEVYPTAMVPWDAIPTLFSTGTLPRTTETLLGNPQEPVNLLAVVPDGCLVSVFLQAGWHVADSPSARTTVRMARAALFDEAYPTAPMTPSFYDTQPHTLGFEKETEEKSARSRHHARFWATRYRTAEGALWVGTASLDTGVKWVITHSIAPDIDTERTLVVADLEKAELVTKMEEFTLVPPTLGKNFSGDAFFTDGRTALLRVKGCER